MKIRSRALYNFLLQRGALSASPEVIAQYKAEYRKLYKSNWKKRQRPRKEIRFELTERQFVALQLQARAHGLRHTTYVRSLVLGSIGEPNYTDGRILEILQMVSMAAISTSHNPHAERAHQLLLKAETLLLNYIRKEEP